MCVSEICCHRRGASRDFERSRFTSRDHSGVPVVQHHWQSVESAGFRSSMPRQSFLGINFVFRKFEKSDPRNFQRGLPALSNLWEFWNADKWAEQHGYAYSYALARESRTVTQREETLK